MNTQYGAPSPYVQIQQLNQAAVPVEESVYERHLRCAQEFAEACGHLSEANQRRAQAEKNLSDATERLAAAMQIAQQDPTQPNCPPPNGAANRY
jgi:hypothetical protein